ncbi:MAG: DUF4430 domain-containing protein [Clostridia bacterium]|nr:DUF4430 domain-containing protein [Clostridia bacterium]
MRRKTSNILIGVLVAVIVFCGVMAIGTFSGWFSKDDTGSVAQESTAAEEAAVQEEEATAEETVTEVQSQDQEEPTQKRTEAPATEAAKRCTITIKCDSILKHLDSLKDGKNKYVPSNGVILSKSTVEFRDGNTVFDVLKATCSAAGINLSAKNSSMGAYVEGINNIFEFDCGGTSGWMYSVNGTTPNHSCSAHKVKNGDNIIWYYSCGK